MNIESIIKISALRFPVTIDKDDSTDIIPVILTKEQLRAAQTIGESSKEVIHRICGRKGYKVVDIGKPERRTFEINLNEMWWY